MLTCWIGFRYRGWHWEVQVGRRVQRHYRVMTEWIDKSACRQVKAGLILPVGIRPRYHRQAAQATAVGSPCTVPERCLTWALRNGEIDGIWGGLDGEQRRAPKMAWQLQQLITPSTSALQGKS